MNPLMALFQVFEVVHWILEAFEVVSVLTTIEHFESRVTQIIQISRKCLLHYYQSSFEHRLDENTRLKSIFVAYLNVNSIQKHE